MNKADFLKECMSDPALVSAPVPINDFTKAYCLLCANRECSRSAGNNMSFDRRVNNWQADLFTNVQRPADDDPNFANIRRKNFAPAGSILTVAGSPNFVSVAARPEPTTAPIETAPTRFVRPEEPVIQATVPDGVQEAPEVSSSTVPIPTIYSTTQAENTPFQQGAVLQSGNAPSQKPEIVLQPGSTFTFPEDE